MSYVGNKPALNFVNLAVQHFTTSATTTYTLNQSVSDEVDIALFINNVRQQPGSSYAYTASGTTLTLSQATAGTDTMYCVFLGKAVETVNPPAGSVNTSELVDNAVTTAKITSDSVTYDKIQDIGTANRVLGSATTGTVGEVQITDSMSNFVSTSSAAGLQIKGDGTTDGTLQLNCSQNSHGIKLKSPPHSAGASYTLTFPTTDGNSSEFLQTNGSGVLTWADAGGGKINQIVQTVKSDTFTSTSTTFADVTGMSVAITPSASTSKVLVMATLNVGNNTDDRWSAYRLIRGSTGISIGDDDGNKTRASVGSVRMSATGAQNFVDNKTIIFLDTPNTTSATTYKLSCKVQSGGAVLTFNRPGNATDADYVVHTASSITAIEVLA